MLGLSHGRPITVIILIKRKGLMIAVGRNNSTNVKKCCGREELELPYDQILAGGRKFGVNEDADYL